LLLLYIVATFYKPTALALKYFIAVEKDQNAPILHFELFSFCWSKQKIICTRTQITLATPLVLKAIWRKSFTTPGLENHFSINVSLIMMSLARNQCIIPTSEIFIITPSW